MEVFSPNNVPELKEGEVIIPLFTLDTLLLPEDQMMMRVFEPRYKQMLDDIVLDELPYGHVISNPSMPELNGISIPYDCLLYTSPSPRDKRQSRMPSSA